LGLITIDGYIFKKFIIAGTDNLLKNKEAINYLNVFPVPDGDTGTNMYLTVLAAALEVEKIDTSNIYEVTKAASNGSLRGARGNSGVILSQLFRGFAKGMEGKETASCYDIAFAFNKASETAYKAVMKPKEGTILTIANAISEKAMNIIYKSNDIEFLIEEVIKYANKTLLKTTDMLPQLKQANVVDAGGKGLLSFIEGGHYKRNNNIKIVNHIKDNNLQSIKNSSVDIKFVYCTEFFINIESKNNDIESNLKSFLQNMGDSIVVVRDENIIKIHIHTNNPGKVIEKALSIGSIENIKIENMKVQHTNKINFSERADDFQHKFKNTGFVVVSSGNGLNNIFKKLGADIVINAGQTMNPSTDDILKAIEKINAENIIILPNNKNIILTAQQCSKICKSKNVFVVPTKNIPQGLTSLINYMPTDDINQNIQHMSESMVFVDCGEVTFAVRDAKVDNIEINRDDFIGIYNDKIMYCSKNLQDTSKNLVEKIIQNKKDCNFISIYYGEDCTEEQAYELSSFINNSYSEIEVEVEYGGQPLYYYIISAE